MTMKFSSGAFGLLGITLLLAACGSREPELFGEPSATNDPSSSSPEPGAELERIRQYLDSRYTRDEVVHSFRTKLADVVDCVEYQNQPGAKELVRQGLPLPELPDVPALSDEERSSLPDFLFNGARDDDGAPRVCPGTTVPVLRVTERDVLAAGGLDAYRTSLAHGRFLRSIGANPGVTDTSAEPAISVRASTPNACNTAFGYDYDNYAHVQQTFSNSTANIGLGSAVLSISPPVYPGLAGTYASHIIGQVWLYTDYGINALGCSCGGAGQPACAQVVEAGWDYAQDTTRLFFSATGDGYATAVPWLAAPSATMTQGMTLPVSVLFGTQHELSISVVKTGIPAGWGIYVGLDSIGLYAGGFPASGFHGAMLSAATTFQAGGETYSPANWSVPMGTGTVAAGGYGQNAYAHDVFACNNVGRSSCYAPIYSPLVTRPANYTANTSSPAKPGSTWANWFYYGGVTSVFWQQNYGFQWAPGGIDWAVGEYKGECGPAANQPSALIGLSGSTAYPYTAHGIQCTPDVVIPAPDQSKCYRQPVHRASSTEWDPNQWLATCRDGEFVQGVSQTLGGGISSVLCCPGYQMRKTSSCSIENLQGQNSTSYYANQGGDWDSGYDKGQCPKGKAVLGVSALAGAYGPVGPRELLCCSK